MSGTLLFPVVGVWANDYNCGGCPACLTADGLCDFNTLSLADIIGNDMYASLGGNGCSCSNITGDYNDFNNRFGSRFSFVWMNDGTSDRNCWDGNFNWLNSHGIPGAWWYHGGGAVEATLKAFTDVAFKYGWLQETDEGLIYVHTYQQNNVAFTPPPIGFNGTDYYGVWDNTKLAYTGPVDPNSAGAVLCWMFTSQTSQYYGPYSYGIAPPAP